MRVALAFVLVAASTNLARSATLSTETLDAWNRYVGATEARIARELADGRRFLAADFLPHSDALATERRLRRGEIVAEKLETLGEDGRPIEVPKGMVHHWRGSVFVPGVGIRGLVSWLQDYDRHASYFDDVEASRLLSRRGETFDVFLKLRRHKVVTVRYDTEHRVTYVWLDASRASSASVATRIAELDRARDGEDVEKPPGDDRGFLWRLRSYWRFQQSAGGVFVECESLSLSRSVPAPLRWLVGRYLDSVPRESLDATLGPIRRRGARSLAAGKASEAGR